MKSRYLLTNRELDAVIQQFKEEDQVLTNFEMARTLKEEFQAQCRIEGKKMGTVLTRLVVEWLNRKERE